MEGRLRIGERCEEVEQTDEEVRTEEIRKELGMEKNMRR
jgi:hypothetical protein